MKKNLKIILCGLLVFALLGVVSFKLWEAGAFIVRRSAEVSSSHVKWKGKEYSPVSGSYSEGRTIAKAKNGNWTVKAVEEDPSHTFIVARSFLDQYLMVSNDYTIPTSGELTTISWHNTYISDPLFLDAVSKIEAEKTVSFTYQTDGLFHLTENQHMRELWFAYAGCPVATNYMGYMGKVNGEWVITTEIFQTTESDDPSPPQYSVSCYKIPSEYWDILSKYFN